MGLIVSHMHHFCSSLTTFDHAQQLIDTQRKNRNCIFNVLSIAQDHLRTIQLKTKDVASVDVL